MTLAKSSFWQMSSAKPSDEACGRVVVLETAWQLVEEADAEDGGKRASFDDPRGRTWRMA